MSEDEGGLVVILSAIFGVALLTVFSTVMIGFLCIELTTHPYLLPLPAFLVVCLLIWRDDESRLWRWRAILLAVAATTAVIVAVVIATHHFLK